MNRTIGTGGLEVWGRTIPTLGVLAGAAWVSQFFLPWATKGPLSSSSMLDGVRLVQQGQVESVASTGTVVLGLVLPLAGILLVGSAGLNGTVVDALRLGSVVLGVVAVGGWVHVVTGWDLSQVGAGAWLALLGAAPALALVTLTELRRREANS